MQIMQITYKRGGEKKRRLKCSYYEISHMVIKIRPKSSSKLVHWPGKRWECGRLPLLSQGPN